MRAVKQQVALQLVWHDSPGACSIFPKDSDPRTTIAEQARLLTHRPAPHAMLHALPTCCMQYESKGQWPQEAPSLAHTVHSCQADSLGARRTRHVDPCLHHDARYRNRAACTQQFDQDAAQRVHRHMCPHGAAKPLTVYVHRRTTTMAGIRDTAAL